MNTISIIGSGGMTPTGRCAGSILIRALSAYAGILPGRADSRSEYSAGSALSSVVHRAQVAVASYANYRFDRLEETQQKSPITGLMG